MSGAAMGRSDDLRGFQALESVRTDAMVFSKSDAPGVIEGDECGMSEPGVRGTMLA